MKSKTLICVIAGSLFLLGCADSAHYPVTKNIIGSDDQVRYMTAPGLSRY